MPRRFPLLRDYEILAEVGTGTLGTVYKVLGRRRNDLVALKRIETGDAELRSRLRRDFARVKPVVHEHLVRLLEIGEDPATLWYTSDLVEGRPLLEFLEAPIGGAPEGVKRAFFLFGQVLKVLAHLHGRGIVHGGIKPTNVLVTRDARVRLTDTALSREFRLEQADTVSSDLKRLSEFCSPEQLAGELYDHRGDLYSVGLLLYQALAGRGPHPGESPFLRAINRTIEAAEPLATGDSRLDQSFGPILFRLLARDPEARPQTAEEVFRELGEAWDRYARSQTRPFALSPAAEAAAAALQAQAEAGAEGSAGSSPAAAAASTAPLAAAGTAPHPAAGTAPHPAAGTAPHPAASTAPHPAASTAPHPAAGTAPHPAAGTAPHPAASTAPLPAAAEVDPTAVTTPLAALAAAPAAPLAPASGRERTQPLRRDDGEGPSGISTAELRVSDLHIAEVLGSPLGDTFPGIHPVLVGRGNELARLEDSYQAAMAGKGRLVAVYGETGIGKTLLLSELASYARAQGATVLFGRGTESRRAPRGPIVAMLEALARRVEKLTPPEREQLLPPEASALSEISQSFRQILPSVEEPRANSEYEAARRKYRLRVALAGLVRRLSERGPLVMSFEDLDEADHETIELIAHVARSLYGGAAGERARAMLVVSYRSDEIDERHRLSLELRKLADERLVQPIELDRLDERSTSRLVASLLGVDSAPTPLAAHIWSETKGNPLFVVETVSWLRDEGVLDLGGGRLNVDAERLRQLGDTGPGGRSLPTGLREVVARRLERLDPASLGVLRTAAVAGLEVRLPLLKQATGLEDAALVEAARTLVKARFLVAPPPVAKLEFDHARVRDVVLALIPAEERKAIAGRLARVREAELGTRKTDFASELATLYDEAGEAPRAIDYLAIAAERHFHDGDLRGALRRWRRVAELLARLDGRTRAGYEKLEHEALKKTARLLALLGQLGLARRLYGDLISRARQSRSHEDEVDALNGLADTEGKLGDFAAARRSAEEALRRAGACGYAAGQAASLENLGIASRRASEVREATQSFREALKIRRSLGDEAGVARVLCNLGLVFRAQDNQERAMAHFEEARGLYTRLHDRLGVAVTLSHLASVHQRKNEYPRAVELYREARQHDEEIGNPRGVALSNQGLGYVFLEEGDYRAALEHFQQALAVFQHIGDRHNTAYALTNLGHAYYRTANHREAVKRYREAIAALPPSGAAPAESEARSGLALALAALGERVNALEEANRAVEAARTHSAKDKEAWARHTLAQVTGSAEQAALALELAEATGNANLIFMVHHTLARFALDRGEREAARDHLGKAFTLIDSIAEKTGEAKAMFLKKPAVEAVFRDAKRL